MGAEPMYKGKHSCYQQTFLSDCLYGFLIWGNGRNSNMIRSAILGFQVQKRPQHSSGSSFLILNKKIVMKRAVKFREVCLSLFGLLYKIPPAVQFINTKNLTAHSYGCSKSNIKVPTWLPFPEALLPNLQLASSPVSSLGRRGQGSLQSLFFKGTNAIHEGSILMT